MSVSDPFLLIRFPDSCVFDPGTVFDILEPYTNFSIQYNSGEREAERASMCAENTRERVLRTVEQHLLDGPGPACVLYGPAGAGKSTIAHTIAKRFDDSNCLAFSCFFSRRNPGRNDLRKFFPSFAYQLAHACMPSGNR